MTDITKHPNPLDENPLDIKNPRPPIVLTDDDKENFFRYFLRDEPYEETVKLFNGKFSVKFRGLTIEDQDQIYSQVAADNAGETLVNQAAYLNKIQLYRLSLAIVTLDDVKFGTSIPDTTVEEKAKGVFRVKKLVASFDKWPVAKLFIINQAYVDFERKMEALANAVKDSAF